MAHGADRTVRAAATVVLLVTLALIFGAMVVNTTTRSSLPAVLLWCALALNVAVLALLLARRPDPFVAILAVVLGAAVAIPLISVAIFGSEPSPPPIMAGVAGSATAVAVLAGRTWERDRTVRWLAIGGTGFVWLTILVGVLSLAGGPVDVAYHRNERDWLGVWQLKGLAGHPNALAMLCGLILLVQLVALLQWRPATARVRLVVAVVLGPGATLLTVLWTQSRTGWVATAVGVIALAVPWRRLGRLGVAVLACVWVVLIVAPPVVARVWGVSFNGRDQAWGIAEHIIRTSPAGGFEPTVFSTPFWQLLSSLGYRGWFPMHAHNVLLEAGVRLGVLGLIFMASAWLLAGVCAVRARAFDQGLAVAAVTAMAVYAGVEPALGTGPGGAVYLPAVLLGLILGIAAVPPGTAGPQPSADVEPDELLRTQAGG